LPEHHPQETWIMPKRDKKAEEDIHEGIKQTKNAIKAFRHYLEFLESGKGLPKAGEARDEQKASYANLIAKLEQDMAALKAELEGLG
jgi:pyruvate dehydrogenase complex dehydrogenase (E1) component